MKDRRDTAFTVELLGLFILLIVVITVISSVFVMSRAHSLQAKQLTEAVILAESTAETASSADSNDGLLKAIDSMDNTFEKGAVAIDGADKDGVTIYAEASIESADTSSDKYGYIVRVTRSYPEGTAKDRADKGAYAQDVIEIFEPGVADISKVDETSAVKMGEPLYTLTAGTYIGSGDKGGEGGES